MAIGSVCAAFVCNGWILLLLQLLLIMYAVLPVVVRERGCCFDAVFSAVVDERGCCFDAVGFVAHTCAHSSMDVFDL